MKKLMVSLFLLSSCLFSCGNVKKIGFVKEGVVYVSDKPSIVGFEGNIVYSKTRDTFFTYTIKEITSDYIDLGFKPTINKEPKESEYVFNWRDYKYKEDKEHIYTFNDFKKLL